MNRTQNQFSRKCEASKAIPYRLIGFTATLMACSPQLHSAELPGFHTSPYFGEQILNIDVEPDISIQINAPSSERFMVSKPVGLVLYALPNGNTLEHTVGKVMHEGDDWHYNIQHIGAQTRFLRQQVQDYNLVTVYLGTSQKSWPAWKAQHPDYAAIVQTTVDSLLVRFEAYHPFLVLSGHSGGGRFILSYLDGFEDIPARVRRISFLDSNYGYEPHYGDQISRWLKGSPDRVLTVLAYNDSVALYNGRTFVSPTGGTWYRSKMMQRDLARSFEFVLQEDDEFIRYQALEGRIGILLKKNPLKKIFHTVQVERNGFIHSMLAGSKLANNSYEYYGARVYDDFIQDDDSRVMPQFCGWRRLSHSSQDPCRSHE